MDKGRSSKTSPIWVIAAVLLPTLPTLYVLSLGPTLYLANHGFLWLGQALEGFYAPLIWIANQCDPLDRALKMYIAWWLT
jgi:hypothetical protein